MPAKLKVYRAEIGGAHEWIVAAPSQKAAAAIWGTDTDVFTNGRGGPTTIPALVDAAMKDPGTPLRRVLGKKGPFGPIPKSGDVETWKLALQAEGLKPGKREKPAPPPKPARAEKPKPEPKPKKDRSALDAAEAALKAFEAEMKARDHDMADEAKAMTQRHAAAKKQMLAKRDALKDAVAAATKLYRLS